MRIHLWLVVLFLTGCATVPRDDYLFRRDIAKLNLTKIPIEAARARLAEHGFVCEKDYKQFADSLFRSVICTHTIPGIACRDDQNVMLEYRPESGLVDRVTTGQTGRCN